MMTSKKAEEGVLQIVQGCKTLLNVLVEREVEIEEERKALLQYLEIAMKRHGLPFERDVSVGLQTNIRFAIGDLLRAFSDSEKTCTPNH